MKHRSIISILVVVASILSHPVMANDSWQEKSLFKPTPAQVKAEKESLRVVIYDSLTDLQVAQAMEQQFNRVEHMMFTRTVITDTRGEVKVDPESGDSLVEDDGC